MQVSAIRLVQLKQLKADNNDGIDLVTQNYSDLRKQWFADVKRDLGLRPDAKIKVGKDSGNVRIVEGG